MSVPAIQMNSSITLAALLRGFAAAPELPVSGIASDSRQLQSGYLFLACEGASSHGLDYLTDLVTRVYVQWPGMRVLRMCRPILAYR